MRPFPGSASLLIAVLAFLMSSVVGCDSTTEVDNDESRVRILLTDAPSDEMVEANVIIERVELIGADNEIFLLTEDVQPFDLLTLRDGVTATLVDIEIPDGTYSQLRVIVDDEAFVLFDDGSEESLKVPSGEQTGIKIPLPALDIDDEFVEITIDFDVDASFVKRGNSGKGYIFKPVLKPLAIIIDGEPVDLGDLDDEDDGIDL